MFKAVKLKTTLLLVALCAGGLASEPALGTPISSSKHYANILTLQHLKNATFQIPDLACGTTPVHLTDGVGTSGDIQVVFGRATFGTLGQAKQPAAAVHLAYFTPELGWLEELVFVIPQGDKLVQSAAYNLDDRDDVRSLAIKDGAVWMETQTRDDSATKIKLTEIRLAQTKAGSMLEVSEWRKDPRTGKLLAVHDLTPYLSTVEERIGRCWNPTNKDRGEHVVVAFKIKPSGEVADLHVSESSEIATADQTALEAVEQAAPFPPLPTATSTPETVCLDFQAGVTLKQ